MVPKRGSKAIDRFKDHIKVLQVEQYLEYLHKTWNIERLEVLLGIS